MPYLVFFPELRRPKLLVAGDIRSFAGFAAAPGRTAAGTPASTPSPIDGTVVGAGRSANTERRAAEGSASTSPSTQATVAAASTGAAMEIPAPMVSAAGIGLDTWGVSGISSKWTEPRPSSAFGYLT
ncbi:hypothetical protein EJ110_NYTH33171 [Nymphaea thermarum]|nr:hypothetical protein EJ110_NYTH33171 [Nymphaea thermarum]